MSKLHRFVTFIVIGLLLLTVLASVRAQESTPPAIVEVTAEQPAIEPSAVPTLEATVVPTAEATVEVPTAEPTLTATVGEQPTLAATEPPVVLPTSTPVIPDLPPLRLLARDLFDTGDPSGWLAVTNWTLVPHETGLSIQTTSAGATLQLVRGPFTNVVAQVSVQITGGTVLLNLRQSEAGAYSVGLDASGSLTLYRANVPVQSVPVSLLLPYWYDLRLAVIDGVVRVALNGIEMIVWQDSAQLPPGTAGLVVAPPQDGAPFIAQMDNFFLWVPEADYESYTPPTAVPVTAVPTELPPSPVPTEVALLPTEVPPTLTPTEEPAQPTATLVPTDVPSPTATSTATATLEPTITPSPTTAPVINPQTGKSQSINPYIPPSGIDIEAYNQPTDAQEVFMPLPFSSADSTTGNDTTGEDNLALPCGFNITATTWYRFIPEVTKKYILTTSGSAFDTILVVYPNNSDVPAELPTNALGCNDDFSKTDFTSRLEIILTAGQTYWIRLGGYNGAHGEYTFTVQDSTLPVPAAPRPSSPTNNLTSNSGDQTFEWLAPATGATPDSYEIQISAVSTFATLIHSATTTADELSHPFTLETDGIYFWRVRALNANKVGGAWSAVWKLTLDTVGPATPVLNTPLDNAVFTATRPSLTWKAVTGAAAYRITLLDNSQDPPVAVELTKTETNAVSFALSAAVLAQPLQHGKTYKWSIAARDAAGNWGDDSPQRSFTVNLLTALADNITITVADKRPTFTWTAAGFTGVQYILEISTTEDFSGELAYTSPELTTTSHKIATALPDATPPHYYWRLRVLNPEGGESTNVTPRSFFWAAAAPPTVTLLTPVTKATVSAEPVGLTWRPLADTLPGSPFTYEMQMATDSTFSTGLIPVADITIEEATASVANLSDGLLYYWRVRALNTDSVPGVWSAAWSLTVDRTPPAAPTLKTPLNNSSSAVVRPTLTWNAVTGAASYRVQLQVKGTTNQLLISGKETATKPPLALSAAVMTAPLQHGVTYEWNVVALDAAKNASAASDTWAFTINLMNLPADSTSLMMTPLAGRPTFSWTAAGFTGAAYQVDVSTSADDFSAPVASCTGTGTNCRLPVGQELPTAGVYYWRLLVLTGGTSGTPQTETVPVRSFALTTTALPGAPRLTSPVNGAAFNELPTLNWSAPTGVLANYELQIATDSLFATLIPDAPFSIPTDTPSYLPVSPLSDGTYWWRVRAVNGEGAWGAWSSVNTFVMDTDPPTGMVDLLEPVNHSSFPGSQPRFTWKPITGAKFYEIELGNSSDFTTALPFSFVVTTTSFTPPGPLLYTTYYWRVRVQDAAGNSGDWSNAFEVKVTSATTAVPVLNYYTSSTSLTWTPITWAEAYEIQISRIATFVGTLAYQDATLLSTSTSFDLPTTLPNGTYYWRVRAQKADSTWGTWSTGVGVFQINVSPTSP